MGLFFILGVTGCFTKKSQHTGADSDSTAFISDTIKGVVTKEVIREKLKELSESEAPTVLKPGAMCYEVAAVPSRLEYVCPKCGEKTLYSTDNAYKLSEIEKCRNNINNIYNLEVALDESQFCHKCSPDIENPLLCMTILYPGESATHKVCGISSSDITLINEFLHGSSVHKFFNEREEPLKNYVERLQTILDISIN